MNSTEYFMLSEVSALLLEAMDNLERIPRYKSYANKIGEIREQLRTELYRKDEESISENR